MDYANMTVDEMVAARDELNGAIKARKDAVKATAAVEADAREKLARENVKEGDVVAFLFGSKKERVEGGKVLKVSEKSVTIESEVFAKGKGYRKYSDVIVEVTEEVDE